MADSSNNFMEFDQAGPDGQRRQSAPAMHGEPFPRPVLLGFFGFLVLNILVCFLSSGMLLGMIAVICAAAQLVGLQMARWILTIGEGSANMVEVGSAIREGSESYVQTMFGTIAKIAVPMTAFLFVFYFFQIGFGKAFMITLSFAFGSFCSSLAGVIGMWSSTRANARVAQTACEGSYRATIIVALRSGGVAGITVVSLAVSGICFLFSLCRFVEPEVAKVPVLLVGYGFGASFVAMFAQLGGGIYTKAADVGADLCGKVEMGIPEDDPRNPAVIADLVGDNVGDCCARGADLFESLSAEIIAAMILGGQLALNSKSGFDEHTKMNFMLFPLVVHVVDLIVSFLGVMAVRPDNRIHQPGQELENPMNALKRGYVVAVGLAAGFFVLTTRLLLHTDSHPQAWLHFLLCGFIGMAAGFGMVLITQYYTDFMYSPVRKIAEAAESGHGTNVIAGLGVGMESTFMPIMLVIAAILSTYYLGRTSGLVTHVEKNDIPEAAAGLFGTAVATMGMLSNLTYVLAMDVYGPITDNAAGIVEMSPDCAATAREIMDRLDAAGNTTKAFTKGFAVGSAGLACFLLFRAFLDIVTEYTGELMKVDIVQPEVFTGGLVGSATVFLFSAYAMQAVGDTAQKVVTEVRRQFTQLPGIVTGECKPEYGACVEIVSKAAIQRMVKPGLLVVFMPILVGGFMRLIGATLAGDELLGARCITAYLVCSSMTAMLVALFLNNSGGAWDNAKKYIEAGEGGHGGKGSAAHQAAVTGDTVGDPCKDTAGPSLHVLMKLTATVTMVLGPIVAVPHHTMPDAPSTSQNAGYFVASTTTPLSNGWTI